MVLCGAALACLVTALSGRGTSTQLLAEVPWDVLAILVSLGLLTELVAASRLFDVLAAAAARRSGAEPRRILALFAVAMFGASGFVNNVAGLLLILPVLLTLLRLLTVDQRTLTWTVGVLLVACNLGGAATPIGDFPAVLLLGRGSMSFGAYLAAAYPATLLALGLLLAIVHLVVRPSRGLADDPLARRLGVAVLDALHRGVTVDRGLLRPAAAALLAMLVAWIAVPPRTGVGPELIAWLGVGAALLASPRLGERLVRARVDVEATLFLLALFVLVGAVRRAGLLEVAARALLELPAPPTVQLVVFLLAAGVVTGAFSAGPAMAALLDVAASLATRLPGPAVYVGLALSVCAGSSLLLTAATSGPMAQSLTERARLVDGAGAPLTFGFSGFVPVGLLAFAVIQTTAIGWALLLVALGA